MSSSPDNAQSISGPDAAALLRAGAATGRWTLDPTRSRVEFAVKHFWHAVTVRGWFEQFEAEGTVGTDGSITGRLSIASASLNTKNKQRDKHLRSADFFDVEAHPATVVTVGGASVDSRDRLSVHGELEAAGRRRPISFPVRVVEAGADAATLQAVLVVDRREFGMTWSPLRVASFDATATVVARFTRAS